MLFRSNTKQLKITSVSLLGSTEKLIWKQTDSGLKVLFPKNKPTEYVHSFKIELSGIVLGDAEVVKYSNQTVVGTYIANHTDSDKKINVNCKVNDITQTQELIVGAHKVKEVSFKIPSVSDFEKTDCISFSK